MVAMFGQVPGVDQDIVDVHNNKLVEELPKHLVHKPLENGRGVGEAIRHDPVFIVARGGNERRLPLVAFPDMNKIIGATHVQLREDAGPTEFLEGGRDQGKRMWELDGVFIEGPVVDAWPQASVLLTHEEEARGRWRGGRAN